MVKGYFLNLEVSLHINLCLPVSHSPTPNVCLCELASFVSLECLIHVSKLLLHDAAEELEYSGRLQLAAPGGGRALCRSGGGWDRREASAPHRAVATAPGEACAGPVPLPLSSAGIRVLNNVCGVCASP